MWQLEYVVEWKCFPNPQVETHPKPPTLKHIGCHYNASLNLHELLKFNTIEQTNNYNIKAKNSTKLIH
jgi:hypothetical protein